MNKKNLIVITFMLICIIIAVLPVRAEPTKGQKVEVIERDTAITYAALSALFAPDPNPYPAPPVMSRYYNPGHILNPIPPPTDIETLQIRDGNQYYLITELNIGGTTYTGVSCNTMDAEMNVKTHDMNVQYDAIWYVGDLGDLSSGFAGNIEARLYNYRSGIYDRLTLHLIMKGFGNFDGQMLMLSFDTNVDTPGTMTGYCLKG